MFCPKCGTKIESGDLFCPSCGEHVEVEPIPQIRKTPRVEVNMALKNSVKNASALVVRNGSRIVVIVITAFMLFILAFLSVTELKITVSGLSGLERLPAATGTLLYMTCLIIPAFLAFQTIRVALIVPGKTAYEALRVRRNFIDQSICLPIVANMTIFLIIAVCSFIFTTGTVMDDKFVPMIIVFAGDRTVAIVCALLCAISLIPVRIDLRSKRPR